MKTLMKYETRRNRTSNIVLLVMAIISQVVFFWGAAFLGKGAEGVKTSVGTNGIDFELGDMTTPGGIMMIVGVSVFTLVAMIALVTIAIETINMYHEDLTRKSGYMIFMTPRSNRQILGSKVCVFLLRYVVTIVLFIVLMCIDSSALLNILGNGGSGSGGTFFEQFTQMFKEAPLEFITTVLAVSSYLFLGVVLAYFAVTLVDITLQRLKSGKLLIALILFFALGALMMKIGSALSGVILGALPSKYADSAFHGLMFVISVAVAVLVYFGTVKLLDRKLAL